MDYKGIAEQILKDVGGSENIASYAHCATRLRLVLVDEAKADKKAVEKIPEVAGSFTAGGQYQIILGPGTVQHVHEELGKIAQVKEASMEDVKKAAAQKMNPVQRGVKTALGHLRAADPRPGGLRPHDGPVQRPGPRPGCSGTTR